jgi:C4-dicarboxylate-specific signal transduction histidine kinase
MVERQVPGEWLDRLLVAHCAVRADAPFEEAVMAHLSAAREMLEEAALGVHIPAAAAPSSGEVGPIVIRLSHTRPSHPTDFDHARLFPEMSYERVIPILVEEGVTLHAASDDAFLFAEGSEAGILVERLALLLGSLIEQRRARARELRELRAQVIQVEKLASLGQTAAGIAHDLNNPLTAIINYSDLLRTRLSHRVDPEDVNRLERVHEAAERIHRFVRDLTNYSRPAEEAPEPVSINDIIERALGFCDHDIRKSGVTVERSLGEVRAVRGVGVQLTQVFVNLFTNAAHAMQEKGGALEVTTEMSPALGEEEVKITVRDEGHGIDPAHRERIFEPFFTTKTDGTGTGLGLSIVRDIVRSHGGRISVMANHPAGTVFHVWLPCAPRIRRGDQD